MTQEDKRLLIKDLCARLPYGVKINVPHHYEDEDGIITLDAFWLYDIQNGRKEIKPYLRPMSSMTPDERFEYDELNHFYTKGLTFNVDEIDWLIAHHFDYRGLIPMGLALEAKEGMYKTD
jgi:hypothetical protein